MVKGIPLETSPVVVLWS